MTSVRGEDNLRVNTASCYIVRINYILCIYLDVRDRKSIVSYDYVVYATDMISILVREFIFDLEVKRRCFPQLLR